MSPVRVLPTEVELAVQLQPCLAERRTYERADAAHPCEFFADQGSFHSFDLKDGGPAPTPGIVQPALYAGRRRVSPEMLSGCRKAPIMSVGINPNLPAYWPNQHNSVLPVFDDVLQYAHHFRYRAVGKLRIPRAIYVELLDGRIDAPLNGEPLADEGTTIPVELVDQRMYLAYQSLLDGLCDGMDWDRTLQVGEDLSYGNMVACGSPRWATRADPQDPNLPIMTVAQQRGIVSECFVERRYFLRQLLQSLPRVLLIFSAATRDAFIRAMGDHFVEGDPQVGEDLEVLLQRRIVLRYGSTNARDLLARVLFVPHASGNAAAFAAVQKLVIDALVEEAKAGNLSLAPNRHLQRPEGGCLFCSNALYHIGDCAYVEQLRPLANGLEESAEADAANVPPELRERRIQERLLRDFVGTPVGAAAVVGSQGGVEEAESGGAPQVTVLIGRVVTMDDERRVLERGALYIRDGLLEAVQDADADAPAGYDDAPIVEADGTIYPGLIDLHNHMPYNVLPPWHVPRQFEDRNQWRRLPEYGAKVRLMQRLNIGRPAMAVARYVEVKALLGGVTSLQGMRSSFKPVDGAMRGLVRNVEIGGPRMPRAGSSVLDLDVNKPENIDRFRRAAEREDAAYFYHLSEGVNARSLRHWTNLVEHQLVGPGLVGIHCLGVPHEGLSEMAAANATVVWSPTSNLMLYGSTLNLEALINSGVRWSLGCDWAPSGGRNPLFELKVARAVAAQQGIDLTDSDLVASVTSNAASAVRWQDAVGRLQPGYHADVLVLAGADQDPYKQLVEATELDVTLVMVDGVARAGTEAMFDAAGVPGEGRESVQIGDHERQLWLQEPNTPLHGFTLAEATETLTYRMETPGLGEEESAEAFAPEAGFQINLDDEMAPLPPEEGSEEAGEDVPEMTPQTPDALTVVGDETIWAALRSINHFPIDVASLRRYYAE